MIWYACPRKKNVAHIDNIETIAKIVFILLLLKIIVKALWVKSRTLSLTLPKCFKNSAGFPF
jgi:hypothetical protein